MARVKQTVTLYADTSQAEEKINNCMKAVEELNAAVENCKKQFEELEGAGEKFSELIKLSHQIDD